MSTILKKNGKLKKARKIENFCENSAEKI